MYKQLEETINYRFENPRILQNALVHPSFKKNRRNSEFEKMEFLGDRVLGLVIADLQFKQFKKDSEADLAKRQAQLVSRKMCDLIAQEIHLEDFMKVENDSGSTNSSILADALEALIAAIFLDGGYKAAKEVIKSLWTPYIQSDLSSYKDSKTTLQEWSQSQKLGVPLYELIQQDGLAHNPTFVVRVTVGTLTADGKGSTKKQAEQKAAELALHYIEKE